VVIGSVSGLDTWVRHALEAEELLPSDTLSWVESLVAKSSRAVAAVVGGPWTAGRR
jgi:hypothetical protein